MADIFQVQVNGMHNSAFAPDGMRALFAFMAILPQHRCLGKIASLAFNKPKI
jgi:hypothetical protein